MTGPAAAVRGGKFSHTMTEDAHRQLLQTAYETTDRAVSAALAEVGSVNDLMEVTGAALGYLEQTLDGIRRSAEVKVDCRMCCSFCCWLRVMCGRMRSF